MNARHAAALCSLTLRLPRCAAVDSGEPGWCAYSGALGRKFLRLDQFLKKTGVAAIEK